MLGEQGLVDELRLVGVQNANEPKEADWLVISLHETLTYEDLNQAFQAAVAALVLSLQTKTALFRTKTEMPLMWLE